MEGNVHGARKAGICDTERVYFSIHGADGVPNTDAPVHNG